MNKTVHWIILAETLNAMIGKDYPSALSASPLAHLLGTFVKSGDLNLNLDGKELYYNAKKCLETNNIKVDDYE